MFWDVCKPRGPEACQEEAQATCSEDSTVSSFMLQDLEKPMDSKMSSGERKHDSATTMSDTRDLATLSCSHVVVLSGGGPSDGRGLTEGKTRTAGRQADRLTAVPR